METWQKLSFNYHKISTSSVPLDSRITGWLLVGPGTIYNPTPRRTFFLFSFFFFFYNEPRFFFLQWSWVFPRHSTSFIIHDVIWEKSNTWKLWIICICFISYPFVCSEILPSLCDVELPNKDCKIKLLKLGQSNHHVHMLLGSSCKMTGSCFNTFNILYQQRSLTVLKTNTIKWDK